MIMPEFSESQFHAFRDVIRESFVGGDDDARRSAVQLFERLRWKLISGEISESAFFDSFKEVIPDDRLVQAQEVWKSPPPPPEPKQTVASNVSRPVPKYIDDQKKLNRLNKRRPDSERWELCRVTVNTNQSWESQSFELWHPYRVERRQIKPDKDYSDQSSVDAARRLMAQLSLEGWELVGNCYNWHGGYTEYTFKRRWDR